MHKCLLDGGVAKGRGYVYNNILIRLEIYTSGICTVAYIGHAVVILPCLPKARLHTRETLEYNSKKFVGTAYTRTPSTHSSVYYIILYSKV